MWLQLPIQLKRRVLYQCYVIMLHKSSPQGDHGILLDTTSCTLQMNIMVVLVVLSSYRQSYNLPLFPSVRCVHHGVQTSPSTDEEAQSDRSDKPSEEPEDPRSRW